MRPALAASALALAAGCSHPDALKSPERGRANEHRLSSREPVGPRVLDAHPFDYAALPRLTQIPVTADLPSSTFSFLPTKDGAELNMTGPLVAEIEIGSHSAADKGDIDLGGTSRPHRSNRYYHLFRLMDETGPFGWTVARSAGGLCGREGQRGRARWQGYVHKSRTAKGLDYVCYEGTFDPRTCGATAERAWRVRARPLVDDTVFAFRVDDGECGPPSMPREERLAIIGPRPTWIGSTAPFSLHRADDLPSFARIMVPIARARSATAVFDTRRADIHLFHGEDIQRGDPWLLSYSVEVVWPASDPAPTAIAFSSILSGNTSATDTTALEHIEH